MIVDERKRRLIGDEFYTGEGSTAAVVNDLYLDPVTTTSAEDIFVSTGLPIVVSNPLVSSAELKKEITPEGKKKLATRRIKALVVQIRAVLISASFTTPLPGLSLSHSALRF